MKSKEVGLKELLLKSRQQLTLPFARTRRLLLILLNISYLSLLPVFLVSEKFATGHYVPDPILGYVYSLVAITNLISLVYNYLLYRNRLTFLLGGRTYKINVNERFDTSIRWASMLSLMFMSFCNMAGVGNPSTDAILTDFALGHSLIVLAAMIIGRRASFVWFLVVTSLLIFVTFFQNGYNYQYNYLTPAESVNYVANLRSKEPWALARKATLIAHGLNPPTISRYFNTWFIFILIAGLTSYFWMGITLDVFKVIPQVTEDIKDAIEATNRQELELERERSQAEEQRLLLREETLSAELKTLKAQINPHFLFNTLNYFYVKSSDISDDLADGILKLAEIMRYSMQDDVSIVRLDQEINYMNQFIDLHQMRYSNKLFINFDVKGVTSEKQVPPFLLIGLVENALKHGKLDEPNHPLVIQIEVTSIAITLYTHNKKNNKKRVESNNIGLSNMQRRLDLTYKNDYIFNIIQDEHFFSCHLIINT